MVQWVVEVCRCVSEPESGSCSGSWRYVSEQESKYGISHCECMN